ncbi:MAG: T9SS type A sorting domain-containing protein, partial [Prolixibacteraceae bacterium]|nr:T9SS type A sorting domain-containing protein [Prolixibacteraceae bacterium]
VDSQIDASRRTGITEKTGGATNIDMSGGTYYGNSANYPKSMRYLNFVSVTNSKFHDMIITEVTDDNFTLGPGCNNNECNKLIGSFAKGGNAMTDKGNHNTWIDCVASNCGSDGWTPKCRYSTFIRCIAANNIGPGFGMYAREEGYANNKDVGAHIIGNKFFDCVSYGSAHSSGFSFNISSNCPGAIIKDNYIQAVCYNNQGSGVYFRNKDDAELGIIKDNEVDIVCYGNKGLSKSGSNNSWAGGLGMENDNSSSHNLIETITGSVVCYDNKIDVNTKGGQNCNITAYHPETEANLVLNDKSSYNNTVTVTDFTCSDSLKTWCQQKYCQDMAVGINRIQLPSSNSQFHIYPNPVELNASIEYNVPDAGLVSLKIYDLMGKELVSLVNEKKQKGLYKTEFWKGFPDLSASKIIDFLKLAKNGKPLEIVHPPEGVDKRTFDIQLQQSELLKSFTYLRNNCNAGLKS